MKEICVHVNSVEFDYDIHSLVKAFYPEADVHVLHEEDYSGSSSEGLPDLHVYFDEASILIQISDDSDVLGETLKMPFDRTLARINQKTALKQLIYEKLSQYTGKELPWGMLTGIRPCKLAMSMIEEKKNEEEIKEHLKSVYLVSDKKSNLAYHVAKKEHGILARTHGQKGYSVYIGIPFCPTTCLYCSFTSFPIVSWANKIDQYLDCIRKELDYVADHFWNRPLDSVYIGGGTPTTLTAEQLRTLLSMIRSKLNMTYCQEFTVEAGRADSITEEKLLVLKEFGVDRISVNPQTMNQKTLDVIGRKHTVEQVKEAFAMARRIGIPNINMDIILGLPGEGEEEVQKTLEEIRKLAPESLTVHSLAVKRASKLNAWTKENGMSLLQNTEMIMDLSVEAAAKMAMHPYYLYRQKNMAGNFENVGYSVEGKEGIYNILIMEEVQSIVALGAGTVTKRVYSDGRIERCDNVKDVKLYMDKIDEMIERKRNLFAD